MSRSIATALFAALTMLCAWQMRAWAEDDTVELLLRIEPPNCELVVDEKPVQLAENGAAALLRMPPGRHALVVKKDGHVTLRKILEVAEEGLEAEVRLAPMLKQVTVQMKSGRVIEGGLISQEGDRITIARGRGGKFKLRKGQ